jgi:hypothetical protein
MTDITPVLAPCPFCGSTRARIDDSVAGAFVSCDLCEAQGPFVEYQQVNYSASMFRSVSVASNGDTIDPPVTVVGQSNDEYKELREKATREAQSTAIVAWNQRSPWQPIKMAPVDAVEILVLDGRKVKSVASSGPDAVCFSNEFGHEESLVWFPTHWQPLHFPPTATPNPHD